MRILSITAQKPHSTGSGTYLTELVRSFARKGCSQAVACGIFRDDKTEFPEGVKCYPVYFKSRDENDGPINGSDYDIPFPVVGMSDIMPYESTLYRDLTPEMISIIEDAFVREISRAIDDLDPDLIICHHLFLLTAIVRKHFPDRKIAGISHGSDLRQAANCDELKEFAKPWISRLDVILALNESQKERITDIYGVSEDKIKIIGTGYNGLLFNAAGRNPRSVIEEIAAPADVPVLICYAGKMSCAKGISELLDALNTINADPDVPSIEVTLAGGCQEPSVREELNKLPDNISWPGQISQAQLADIFRYSDIFVLPSYYEGLPLVLIEAMASGMIPVCTDLPGVRPWIEANIPDHNVVFIPMPEMETIDSPTEEGRKEFTANLVSTLTDLTKKIKSGELPGKLPDTHGITWDSVASKVLALSE